MLRVTLLSTMLVLAACSSSASEGFTAAPESFTVRNVTIEGEESLRTAASVDTSYFGITQPLLGRRFADHEYSDTSSTAVALISHELWSTRFFSRPSVIGTPLQVDGVPHIIVGVLPEGVDVPVGVSIWLPRRN